MIRDQILQAIAEVGVVTAVIFTVVVTWTTTTTATPTTTAGPANKGEARWAHHAAMRALIRIEEEAHEKSSARSQRFENCAQNNTWFAQCSIHSIQV